MTAAPDRRTRHRHVWIIERQRQWGEDADGTPLMETQRFLNATGPEAVCFRCGKTQDEAKSRRGRTVRSYGNRAELAVARRYGGEKIGHHGGPVDVRGVDFDSQVRTHRRPVPAEWRKAFAAMPGTRIPRLLLRFVGTGVAPVDFVVLRGEDWIQWFGRDEETP